MEGEWWFAIQMASRLRMSPSDHSRKGLYAGQSGSSVDQGIDSWLLSRSEITIPKWSIRVEKKCSLPILRVNSPCAHQSKHDWSFKKHSLRIKGIGGSGLKIYNHKSAGIEIHHFKRRLSLQFHWFRKLIDPQGATMGSKPRVVIGQTTERLVRVLCVPDPEVDARIVITFSEMVVPINVVMSGLDSLMREWYTTAKYKLCSTALTVCRSSKQREALVLLVQEQCSDN
ncbi:hypothetical protein Tco_1315654 [Tanacetum coccineum]